MSQRKPQVEPPKLPKATKWWVSFVLYLIGWKSETSFLNQSQSKPMQSRITSFKATLNIASYLLNKLLSSERRWQKDEM